MKQFKSLYLFLFIYSISCLFTISHAQVDAVPTRSVSYVEYIDIVGKQNLSYAAEKYNVSIAQARVEMAKVFPDPQISFGGFDNGQQRMRMGYGVSTGITYTLELGGKRKARINLATSQAELVQIALERYFHNLQADATLSYLQAIKQEYTLYVKTNSYNSMKKLADADSIRFLLGSINEVNARQSKVEAKSMQNNIYQSEADWKASMLQMGMMAGIKQIDTLYFPEANFLKFDRDFNLLQLITTAQNNRSDLLVASKYKDVSQKTLQLAKANRTIDLGMLAGVNNTAYVINIIAPTPSYSTIYGGIAIPLKFSNKYRGEISAAEYGIKQADIAYQNVELQIQIEVTQAYYNYLATRKQVQQFNSGLLDDAKKVLEGKTYSYERGETSLLEVLNAQRTHNDIQFGYYETLYNYAASLVELERAAGIWDINF
jgi:cobalt-zinc-cadmium efflux system outer membrane protein